LELVKNDWVKTRKFLIALLTLFFLFILLITYLKRANLPPREAQLLLNFNQHRAGFEQLRDMLLVDTNLSRVASWGVETDKPFFLGYPSGQNFPINRFQKYLALLKETGGKAAARAEGEPANPIILVWARGWGGDIQHIGICWLDRPPTNMISKSDDFQNQSQASGAYCHIDSNWFFWTDL
jgi:hypothetical protein